ncbi:MAG: sigma-E factor negative regulatory protein [Lysobacterales bacterium]
MDKQHSGDMGESLCCLMDGELDDNETQFLLRRLDHDQALRERWERYHQARSIMQDHHGATGHRDASAPIPLKGFAAGVAAAIAAEPTPEVEQPLDQSAVTANADRSSRGWLQPLAGMAVAASVAVVAFNAWQPQLDAAADQAASAATAQPLLSQTVSDPTGEFEGRVAAPASSIASQASTGGDNPKLQRYLIRHSQASAAGHRLPRFYYPPTDASARPVADTETDDTPDTEQQDSAVSRP